MMFPRQFLMWLLLVKIIDDKPKQDLIISITYLLFSLNVKFIVFDYFGEMEDYNVFCMGLCASNILSPNKSLNFETFCSSKSPPL